MGTALTSIRRRIVVMIVVVAMTCVGAVGVIVPTQVFGLLDRLDAQDARDTASRLEHTAQSAITQLSALAGQWAATGPTIAIASASPEGAEASVSLPGIAGSTPFDQGGLGPLGIDGVVVVGVDGGEALRLLTPAEDAGMDVVLADPRLEAMNAPGQSTSFVVEVADLPWLVGASTIPVGGGEVGLLVLMCRVDDARLAEWGTLAGVEARVSPTPGPVEPVADGDVLRLGTTILGAGTDLHLVFEQPRDARLAGTPTTIAFLVLFVLAGIMATIWFGFWLDRRILQRLLRLKAEVDEVDLGRSGMVETDGDDEITALGGSINGLLDRVAEGRRELRDRNEQLEQASRTRDAFLSMISHELRTPLTAILGFSETVEKHWAQLSDERRHEMVGRIHRQGKLLDGLVADLLTMRRAADGFNRHDSCEIDRVVPAIVGDLPDEVAVDVELRPGAQGVIAAIGPEELRRLLANLVINASKYGAAPYVIATRVDRRRGDNGPVVLTVTDHGPGVPDEFVDDLFKPFTQASQGDRRTATGVGLGLSIVDALVKEFDGRIRYERPPDGGARFVIEIPTVTRLDLDEASQQDELEVDEVRPIPTP